MIDQSVIDQHYHIKELHHTNIISHIMAHNDMPQIGRRRTAVEVYRPDQLKAKFRSKKDFLTYFDTCCKLLNSFTSLESCSSPSDDLTTHIFADVCLTTL